jgi:hypothetical protein
MWVFQALMILAVFAWQGCIILGKIPDPSEPVAQMIDDYIMKRD